MTGDHVQHTGSQIRRRKLVPHAPEVRSGGLGCDFRRYRKSHPPIYSVTYSVTYSEDRGRAFARPPRTSADTGEPE